MLSLHTAADRNHLRDDAQLAEELAVRYGDAVRTFKPESLTEVRRRRAQCLDTLFGTVGATHGVSPATVAEAALRRNVRADVGVVYLPLAILFSTVVMFIWRRFESHLVGPHAWLAFGALVVGSLGVSAASVVGGELWSSVIEMIRFGNDHISMRGGRVPYSTVH